MNYSIKICASIVVALLCGLLPSCTADTMLADEGATQDHVCKHRLVCNALRCKAQTMCSMWSMCNCTYSKAQAAMPSALKASM